MRELVIEKSQFQSRSRRLGYRFLTLGVWAFFLYLIRPLLTIFAWFLGFSLISRTMIGNGGWEALTRTGSMYAAVVAGIAILLGGWALCNALWFRGMKRRRRAPTATLIEMASLFEVDPAELTDYRRSQVMKMRHDEQGNILQVLILNDMGPGPDCVQVEGAESLMNAR